MKNRLAAPFVMTVGLMAAGCPAEKSPPPKTVVNVPPDGAGGAAPDAADDDDDVETTDPALASSERIEKRADGTCWIYPDVECPPSPATCNPPPPQKVDCPPDMQ